MKEHFPVHLQKGLALQSFAAASVVVALWAFTEATVTWAQPPGEMSRTRPEDRKRKGRNYAVLTPGIRVQLDKLPPKERQAIELLGKMVTRGMMQPFIAREITIKANGRETEQWVRWHPKQGMRRESIRPDGDIFIDDLKKSYFYSSKEGRWYSRTSVLPRTEGRIGNALRSLYRGDLKAILDGQDTVAGRTADIVRVAPPDGKAGPITRVWIDRPTGMRLKTETITVDGRLLTSTYYISLDLNPKFRPDDFTAPADAVPMPDKAWERVKVYTSREEAAKNKINPCLPTYLPGGFTLRVIEVVNLPGNAQRVTTRFGNGITVLSLVQMPVKYAPRQIVDKLNSAQGFFATDPRGGLEHVYIWRSGELVFTLFGQLPDDELGRIANSVR